MSLGKEPVGEKFEFLSLAISEELPKFKDLYSKGVIRKRGTN